MVLGARKYNFTPELTALLRDAYRAQSRGALSKRLKALRKLRPWPAGVWYQEARRLGLTLDTRVYAWSEAEDRLLIQSLDADSVTAVARKLDRSPIAVQKRARQLDVVRQARETLDSAYVAACFGVSVERVASWAQKGLLRAKDGLFTEDAVAQFVREYPAAYDLRCVDQSWFKYLLTTRNQNGKREVDRLKV